MAEVWDRATEFLSDNLGTVTPIALLLILVPISIQGNLAPLIKGSSATTVLVIRLVTLVLAMVSLVGQLAVMALALDPDRTTSEASTVARARLPRLLLVVIALIGALCVAALPVVVMIAAAGNDPMLLLQSDGGGLRAMTLPPGMGLGLVAYGLVASIVLLWLSARLVLIYPVVVAENLGFGAIARSFRLTQGLTWPIIGMLLLYAVVSTVTTLAAQTVFGSIFAIVAGSGGPDLGVVLTAVIVAAVAAAFAVLSAAFTAKLYIAARRAAEPAVGAA